tara:strand:+ start:1393 stop:2163 length:771 start_codon:yes stop_codon:yes gene_type:complete
MAVLYSLHGGFPKPLPEYVRLPNNAIRTSLETLSDEELSSLGFVGPITLPTYDEDTETLSWDSETHTAKVIDLSVADKNYKSELKEYEKRGEIYSTSNLSKFFNEFKESDLYSRLLDDSLKDVNKVRVLIGFTQSLTSVVDGDIHHLQDAIDCLYGLSIKHSSKDDTEFRDLLNKYELLRSSGLAIKEKSYFSDKDYYPKMNLMVIAVNENTIFPSHTWDAKNWKAIPPQEKPDDGKNYEWDEEQWNKTKNGWVEI